MTDEHWTANRRRVLSALVASGAAAGLAGCSDGDSGETPADEGSGDGSGDGGSNGGSENGGGSGGSDETATAASADPTATAAPGETDTQSRTATGTPSPTASGPEDGVTVDLSLTVRESQSNVEQFDTLQTTFEAVELASTGGETVRLDDETREIDLTEVGPGGSVDLFETTVPAGGYEEGKLYLPIQDATLAEESEPEFSRTVPATRELGVSGPLEFEAGDEIDLTVTVALLQIGGDGPWTYTVGFGASWI